MYEPLTYRRYPDSYGPKKGSSTKSPRTSQHTDGSMDYRKGNANGVTKGFSPVSIRNIYGTGNGNGFRSGNSNGNFGADLNGNSLGNFMSSNNGNNNGNNYGNSNGILPLTSMDIIDDSKFSGGIINQGNNINEGFRVAFVPSSSMDMTNGGQTNYIPIRFSSEPSLNSNFVSYNGTDFGGMNIRVISQAGQRGSDYSLTDGGQNGGKDGGQNGGKDGGQNGGKDGAQNGGKDGGRNTQKRGKRRLHRRKLGQSRAQGKGKARRKGKGKGKVKGRKISFIVSVKNEKTGVKERLILHNVGSNEALSKQ
jgi:hypothetical protein